MRSANSVQGRAGTLSACWGPGFRQVGFACCRLKGAAKEYVILKLFKNPGSHHFLTVSSSLFFPVKLKTR